MGGTGSDSSLHLILRQPSLISHMHDPRVEVREGKPQVRLSDSRAWFLLPFLREIFLEQWSCVSVSAAEAPSFLCAHNLLPHFWDDTEISS